MTETMTFGAYVGAGQGRREWKASLAASSAIYVGLALAVIGLGSATRKIVRDKAVDVTFVEKVVKETPPPTPVPAAKPQAPAAAAPVVRPDQKIRRLEKPPPPKEMTAPKEMPKQAAPEADPALDEGVAVYGDGNKADAAGLEGGVTEGGVVGGIAGGAIALPEDAVPPTPAKSNPIPIYPQEAKASGKTGTVVLKVVILADGSVGAVEVMRGEEPFVSAALASVKRWKYEPARYKGQAITVYRIIRIPFKLTA